MILYVCYEIRFFLLILLTMMCSFAQAYWVLMEKSSGFFGSSIWQSYLYTFIYMLGQNIDPNQFSDSDSFALNVLLLAFFMIFLLLLMLNLLIAIMNDSYRSIKEKGLAQWRLEQGGIILDDTFIKIDNNNDTDPYLYVLSYNTSNDKSTKKDSSTLDFKIKERFESLNQSNTDANQKTVEGNTELMLDLLSDIDLKINRLNNIENSIEKKVKESFHELKLNYLNNNAHNNNNNNNLNNNNNNIDFLKNNYTESQRKVKRKIISRITGMQKTNN